MFMATPKMAYGRTLKWHYRSVVWPYIYKKHSTEFTCIHMKKMTFFHQASRIATQIHIRSAFTRIHPFYKLPAQNSSSSLCSQFLLHFFHRFRTISPRYFVGYDDEKLSISTILFWSTCSSINQEFRGNYTYFCLKNEYNKKKLKRIHAYGQGHRRCWHIYMGKKRISHLKHNIRRGIASRFFFRSALYFDVMCVHFETELENISTFI